MAKKNEFEPSKHSILPQQSFKDFELGEKFFALAHGFMTLIQAAIGASPLAHILGKNLIGFVEQSCKFLKPVYCGDTIYPIFEINELSPNNSTGIMGLDIEIYNQNKQLVLKGIQRYLIKL